MFLLSSLAKDFAQLSYKRASTNLSWLYVAFASGCTVRLYLWSGCEWSSARTKLAAGCQSMSQPTSTSGTVLLGSWKLHGSCGPTCASHCICPECCQYLSLMSTFLHFLLLLQFGLFPSLLLSKKKTKKSKWSKRHVYLNLASRLVGIKGGCMCGCVGSLEKKAVISRWGEVGLVIRSCVWCLSFSLAQLQMCDCSIKYWMYLGI